MYPVTPRVETKFGEPSSVSLFLGLSFLSRLESRDVFEEVIPKVSPVLLDNLRAPRSVVAEVNPHAAFGRVEALSLIQNRKAWLASAIDSELLRGAFLQLDDVNAETGLLFPAALR